MRPTALLLAAFLAVSAPVATQAAGLEETFQQAQAAYQAGDLDRAAALFMETGNILAAKKDARAGLMWRNAAMARMKQERYADAVEILEKILAGGKGMPMEQLLPVYKAIIRCRSEMKEWPLKADAAEQMLKALPKMPREEAFGAQMDRGDAYRDMELYVSAVEAYSKATALMPRNADPVVRAKLLTTLGLCQGNLGDYAGAVRSLTEARKLAGAIKTPLTMAEADSNLGSLAYEQGDYPAAMAKFNAALEIERKAGLRRLEGADCNNLGAAYRRSGNYREAMRCFEEARVIAREVGDVRHEAIATVNRALLHRITGNIKEAHADYARAMKLYEQCKSREGVAIAHIGLGRMEEAENEDYVLAREHYEKALAIFTDLSLWRWRGETHLHLAHVYEQTAESRRSGTRDLVVDESSTAIDLPREDALARARTEYDAAMRIARAAHAREMIWDAHRGFGRLDFLEGRLESALEHYLAAIDIVTKMHVALKEASMLGEFMAGKEDLYGGAMEVCAALHERTKDRKYLDLQMRFSETLRNDVLKASAAVVKISFADKKQQALYEAMNGLGRRIDQASKAVPVVARAPANAAPNEVRQAQMMREAAAKQLAQVQKLEGDYEAMLATWKEQYPQDAAIFESGSHATMEMIQKNLQPDQVALQYLMLPEKLIVNVISNDNVESLSVDVSKDHILKLIKEDFLVGYVEGKGYGRRHLKHTDSSAMLKYAENEMSNVVNTLGELYGYLIRPIESLIERKKRLYIISDGFLAQLPFGALVKDAGMKNPVFLVENHDIAYLRPSFINVIGKPVQRGRVKKLLAIANADNKNFDMGLLSGTVDEIRDVNSFLRVSNIEKSIGLEAKSETMNDEMMKKHVAECFPGTKISSPTEDWVIKNISSDMYEIVYFATHGMPYSNVYTSMKELNGKMKELSEKNKKSKKLERMWKMFEKNLNVRSPLNGFLYLSGNPKDDILQSEIPPNRDGLLTIREIMGIQAKQFSNTKYVILSACNTGVTFAPVTLYRNEDDEVFNAEATEKDFREVEKDLRKNAWIPGVEQVSFVETFLKKGALNVYGTLWFADDLMSSIMMSRFMKNLSEQESSDPVVALCDAQRSIIKDGREKNGKLSCMELGSDLRDWRPMPQHPFFWAVGAIFGK